MYQISWFSLSNLSAPFHNFCLEQFKDLCEDLKIKTSNKTEALEKEFSKAVLNFNEQFKIIEGSIDVKISNIRPELEKLAEGMLNCKIAPYSL